MTKTLGIKIRQLRELKGFSQEYMAHKGTSRKSHIASLKEMKQRLIGTE